ncbi:DNA-directed RNA polymerase subunit omega [Paenibacillus profundus]|uniref:DNA-directed RNA polymerase subunit omega n=1 Tax=Paenibacillus profundus TaxID=1173085 RepID=A0ABS8YAJ5_9BACL|nr:MULTISPECIES: DNA-directed RNA polymerase subunit omega [Paenibacillus]MCE5167937.1 DNA-directed RNA polymerase subunit omega [Paenibacillus profundus]MCM3337187.1 DNA-directed RNA polymerase subunit omega [Paenibacillus sp. MER TA 81-3]
MLYPSIDELMKKVDSKYSLVVAASRRARQLRDGNRTEMTQPKSHKQVGVALEEIYGDNIFIQQGTQTQERSKTVL